MSTRSDIIVKHPNKEEYASIYTHNDGYPSHHGTILLENYGTYEKVVELILLGDLSELCDHPEGCLSYHRWRGEAKNIKLSSNIRDHVNQSYSYLFKDGEWWFTNDNYNRFKKLTSKDCK